MKKIFVKPITRQSVQGRNQQIYHVIKDGVATATQQMNRTKAKDAAEAVIFERDSTGTKLKAGMSQRVTNPFLDLDVKELRTNYNLSEAWTNERLSEIVAADEITVQTKLEILAGEEPNAYTENTSRKRIPGSVFIEMGSEDERTQLEKFKFYLYDRTNVITDESARQRLAMQAVMNSSWIAPNKESINPNVHHFYISQEFEEEEQRLKVSKKVNKAIATLVALDETKTHMDKYRIATVITDRLGNSLVPSNANATVVENALDSFLDRNNKSVKENSDKFMSVVKRFTTEPDKFYIDWLIQEAMNHNVISIQNGIIYWHSKTNDPGMYKFNSLAGLASKLYAEREKYNPDEPEMHNYYGDFIREVSQKGVQL